MSNENYMSDEEWGQLCARHGGADSQGMISPLPNWRVSRAYVEMFKKVCDDPAHKKSVAIARKALGLQD